MRLYLLLILISLTTLAEAQFVYELDQSVRVNIDDDELTNAWAGGLNAVQYNTMDLNDDGKEDIVAFDRTGNKVYPFVLEADGGHRYTPEYAMLFPDDLKAWMLLRDFNCDGKKDIFTSHTFGIQVFVNTTAPGGTLSWERYVTGRDNSGNNQYYLKTKGFTSDINMQINESDIPAIEDIDGDSDLDILLFRPSGDATVEFHKNLSMENDGTCDSLQYERITQAWGNFTECECGDFAFNGKECLSSHGKEDHQSGKALLLLDMDGDGDKDVVVSEESCQYLFYLENEGTATDEVINAATHLFPNEENPVSMFVFPVAYYEDIDADGARDIIVSPNIGKNISSAANFEQSNWLYKNIGSDQLPKFTQVKKNFLQDQMLDLGENAAPEFGDYDNDGDLDMLVGSYNNHTEPGMKSSLRLFKNTGSAKEPDFVLENENYLNLAEMSLFNIKPKLKDINGDNRPDLVFSATELSAFSTNIYYFLNQGDGAFNFSGEMKSLFTELGLSENFEVSDINADGLVDLLIGKSTGQVEYYKNTGQKNNPQFSLEDESFYNFDLSNSRYNMTITIADLNNDGAYDMITGDERGNLTLYSDFRSHLDNPHEGLTNFLQSSVTEEAQSYNFGSRLYPVTANLFAEDRPAIVIGSGQGGLQMIRNTDAMPGYVNRLTIDIFPNPVIKSSDKYISISTKITGTATVVSVLGQRTTKKFYLPSNRLFQLPVAELSPGLYIIILEDGDGVVTGQRFIVIE